MTADEVLAVAKKHEGRYLILLSEFMFPDNDVYRACESLVNQGKARWMAVHAWHRSEPGPGIQLTGLAYVDPPDRETP